MNLQSLMIRKGNCADEENSLRHKEMEVVRLSGESEDGLDGCDP